MDWKNLLHNLAMWKIHMISCMGILWGDLQGLAFGTVRIVLGREMTEDEREDLAEIIKSKRIKVQNIVNRIKKTNVFDLKTILDNSQDMITNNE